jgi:transcriptional regulator with XRE-family HTH domain
VSNGLYGLWGRKMKAYREVAGLSRKEAAMKLTVSGATLSRWEAGKVMPGDEKKLEIAELYGVEPRTLFPLERAR